MLYGFWFEKLGEWWTTYGDGGDWEKNRVFVLFLSLQWKSRPWKTVNQQLEFGEVNIEMLLSTQVEMLRRQLEFESQEARARDMNLGVTVNTGYFWRIRLEQLHGTALHATLWQSLWDCVLSASRLVSLCQQQSVTAPPGQEQAAVFAKDVFFIYYMVVLLPIAFKILTKQDCDFKINMK